jgi:hypothetical protein
MAGTLGRVRPDLGRQARAALIMDSADLGHDTVAVRQDAVRQAYPGLPCTPLSACLRS